MARRHGIFTMRRAGDGSAVATFNGEPLEPRLDLYNHSPTGFEWGYGGSGPAQLALAILAKYLDDDGCAVLLHQPVKWRIVAPQPRDSNWELTTHELEEIVDDLLAVLLSRHPERLE